VRFARGKKNRSPIKLEDLGDKKVHSRQRQAAKKLTTRAFRASKTIKSLDSAFGGGQIWIGMGKGSGRGLGCGFTGINLGLGFVYSKKGRVSYGNSKEIAER